MAYDVGLQVFFAPAEERKAAAGRSAPDLQTTILERLRDSRCVVLLWSRFVDKSEWVAFETAAVATLGVEQHSRIPLIVVDLAGPPTPPWLPIKELFARDDAEYLTQLVGLEDWSKFELVRDAWLAKRQSPSRWIRSGAIAWGALVEQDAWAAEVRRALPRLTPDVSLGHLAAPDFEKGSVRRLLRDVAALPIAMTLLLMLVAMAASWIIPYPFNEGDQAEDVRKHLLSVGSAAVVMGPLLALRAGVAVGIAATIVSGLVGPAVALIAGLYTRHGAVADGAVAGIALGAAAMVSFSLAFQLDCGRHEATEDQLGTPARRTRDGGDRRLRCDPPRRLDGSRVCGSDGTAASVDRVPLRRRFRIRRCDRTGSDHALSTTPTLLA